MKIELGKTKIRGFRFADKNQGCLFLDEMENYIGKIGVITHLITTDLGEKIRVEYGDYACDYPYYLAEDYIVKEERFKVDWNYWIDLRGVDIKPLANIIYPITIDFNPKGCGIIEEITTKINNRNNMKNLKITAPEGYEIDKEKSTFEEIVFKPIKKELPKSWEELGFIEHGYHVTTDSEVNGGGGCYSNCPENYNTFATKEQAEASIALAQLSQLREVYRDGWKPDWKNNTQIKFTIYFREYRIETNEVFNAGYFLSFQSEKVRDLFLNNFRDLIEQAKPLMS